MSKQQIPKRALYLSDMPGGSITITTDDSALPESPERLDMLVYSGMVIHDHWYWGELAIDLTGGIFPKESYPVLEDHCTEKKIAVTGQPIIAFDGLRLDPNATRFIDTPESEQFRKLTKIDRFPYQASIHAEPIKTEEIEAGASAEVNGYVIAGPATIWRQWVFKEASVCVFGWDSNTKSTAMSLDVKVPLDIEVCRTSNNKKSGENTMAEIHVTTAGDPSGAQAFPPGQSPPGAPPPPKEAQPPDGKTRSLEESRALLEEILKQFPELAAEVTKADGESKPPADGKPAPPVMSEEDKKKAPEKQMSEITELKNQMARQAMSHAKEVADTELAVALGRFIVLGESPEEQYKTLSALEGKFKKLVPFTDFIKDNVFNKSEFQKALRKEVADFALLMPAAADQISGFGSLSRGFNETSEAEENKKIIDRLYSFSRIGKTQVSEDPSKLLASALMQFAKQSGIGG